MELGDKLYYVLSDFSGVSISEVTVVSIKDKYFVCKYKRTSNEELIFTNKDFGKTIFSDKKEAEHALCTLPLISSLLLYLFYFFRK